MRTITRIVTRIIVHLSGLKLLARELIPWRDIGLTNNGAVRSIKTEHHQQKY